MPTEQLRIGRLHPALLGTCNRVARYEARWHPAKCKLRRAHHIAFGTADIRENRLPQVHTRQQRQQLLHGQDRYR